MFKDFEDALKAVEKAKAIAQEAEQALDAARAVLSDATNKASSLHNKLQAEVSKLIPTSSKVVNQ